LELEISEGDIVLANLLCRIEGELDEACQSTRDLGEVGETNPDVDLVVSNNIAEGSDVEFHDCYDRDDVLVGGKVDDVVGLWDAEEGELRVRDVRE